MDRRQSAGLSETWRQAQAQRSDRRRWLLALFVIAIFVFNYPWLHVLDNLLPPPMPAMVLFGSWAAIIAVVAWIMSSAKP